MSGFSVVFDMDGVIFDTETVGLRAWVAVGERHSLENVEHYARECIGRSTKDTMAILRAAYKDVDIEHLRAECTYEFKRIIAAEGLTLKKGVKELLEWLKENGIKTAIASSTEINGVKGHLRMAGIEEYFEKIIGGDMVTHSKPEPEIYLKACEQLGEKPENTYAIEDSNNGIISAFRAGMHPLLVPDIVENTPEVRQMAEREFKDLLEVRDFLAQR
ncbi:MAG: HAD family phosphatase [Ruminococcus sp.]|nr:HAD family phosphatase [Ruminococcus sp.]